MTAFGINPTRRVASRAELLASALDTPFSFMDTLANQFPSQVMQQFGLGTVLRDFQTPALPGMGAQPIPRGVGVPGLGNTNMIADVYQAARDAFGARATGEVMTEEEYKTSPYFRNDIPWDRGMTTDRAASLAAQYDLRVARDYYSEKQPIANLMAGLAAGFTDPINYVPVFGPAARAAAAARFGVIGGNALIGAGEGAINTMIAAAITADARAKFGDDVSFEASINDIVFSAIAGGVMSAGASALAKAWQTRPRALARLAAENTVRNLETTKNNIVGRQAVSEMVDGFVNEGEGNLSPRTGEALTKLSSETVEATAGSRALADQTANVQGSAAGEIAITPNGTRVAVRPEIVEASDLVKATGALQVRDRSRAASDAQIQDIALNLDPARLMPAVAADQGAPIVGADNVVDSGNGRVAAILRAKDAYPEKYTAYKGALEAAGYDLTGFDTPVLVSRRLTDLTPDARAQFNADANQSSTARMSASEIAAMDRAAVTESALDVLAPGPVNSAANRPFITRVLNNLSQNERSALVDQNGYLNAEGVRRMEAALVAKAYGDVDASVLRRFSEATDDNTKSIMGAMSDAAGEWAVMRNAVKRGDINPDFDATAELTEALRLLSRWREQAATEKRPVSTVIKEGMAQTDLLNGSVPPEVVVFIRSFYHGDDFGRAVSRETIAGRLIEIAKASVDLGRPQLLGDAYAATKLGVLQRVIGSDIEADLFSPDRLDGGFGAGGVEGRSGRAENVAGDSQGTGQDRSDRRIPAAAIEREIASRFEAAGRPAEEAEAVAALLTDFYYAQAARLGVTVDDLIARVGVPEVRGGPGDGGLMQSASTSAIPRHIAAEILSKERVDIGLRVGKKARFWRGISESSGDNGAVYGTGLYVAGSRADALEYAGDSKNVIEMDHSDLPQNPLRFSTVNDFKLWMQRAHESLGYDGPRGFNKAYPDLRDFIEALGADIDGIQISTGKDAIFVNYGGRRVSEMFQPAPAIDPTDPRILFQPAYHGSPHIFDRFSTDYMGTGEGAQAFGWGLYFAGRKGVAEFYRGNLTNDLVDTARRALEKSNGDMAAARKAAMAEIDRLNALDLTEETGAAKRADLVERQNGILRELDIYEQTGEWRSGRLYRVEIPDDSELMAWDAPLSEQSAGVQKIIRDMPEYQAINQREQLSASDLAELGIKSDGPLNYTPTGREFYETLSRRLGGDRAASQALRDAGIPGHRFLDQGSRSPKALADAKASLAKWEKALEERPADAYIKDEVEARRAEVAELEASISYNYVIYDDSRVSISDFEQRKQSARGSISFGGDGRTVINLFENADASTALHETGHYFLEALKSFADDANAPRSVLDDWDAVKAWWRDNADAVAQDTIKNSDMDNVTGADVMAVLDGGTTGNPDMDKAIDIGLHEQWARAFEAYLRDGSAPSEKLRSVFQQFKEWLTAIYRSLTDLNVEITPEIRKVFDNLLAPPPEQIKRRANEMIEAAPERSFDEYYAAAQAAQDELGVAGDEIATITGAEWRNPGIKDRAGAEEKMVRKGYKSTRELTDVVRGGFAIATPEQADAVIAELSRRFDLVDEGWRVLGSGYFDRKAMVKMSDGTLAEVQFWHPDMFDAKEKGGGHLLYEEMRSLKPDNPRFAELVEAQRAFYADALSSAGEAWVPLVRRLKADLDGMSTPGNVARNAPSGSGTPESMTSAAMTGSQPLPPRRIATETAPSMSAGRPSQSNNSLSIGTNIDEPNLDFQTPAPEPRPEGIEAAEATIGKPDDIRALAEQHGVKEDGTFIEQGDIDQLREQGRLTAEDEAEIAAAEAEYEAATAYAETVKAATACAV